jgi:hypothetical protein
MFKKFLLIGSLAASALTAGCAVNSMANNEKSTQTIKETKPATGWAVEPSKFYDVCLPIHTQLASERKEANPEIVAHYICKLIEGVCKSNPTGSDCQKGQKEIREYLEKKK